MFILQLLGNVLVGFGAFVAQFLLGCFHYLFKLAQFLPSLVVGGSLECFDTLGHGFHCFFGMGDCWICDVFVLELDRVGQPLALG